MDDLPDRIELLKTVDGTAVAEKVGKLTRRLAQERIDSKWWELPEVSKRQRRQENDHHWQWAKRVGELKNDRWHEAVAAQTDDDDVQGAILYWVNTKSFVDERLGAVQVEALATAPRNRPWLVESPLYRGVGEALLLRAVIHSYLLKLDGRVNLIAFEDPRTIAFYKRRGFVAAGYDGDLPRFELTSIAGTEWLREEGYDL